MESSVKEFEMQGLKIDKSKWQQLWLDTPFARPGGNSPEQAMTIPGNCVKSQKIENQFPKYHGRITEFSDEKVVLIAHNDGFQDLWVWEGTKDAYFKHWDCD